MLRDMKPYSAKKKTKYNYTDCHPKKGYENWWEFMAFTGSNTATRMKVKQEIRRVI